MTNHEVEKSSKMSCGVYIHVLGRRSILYVVGPKSGYQHSGPYEPMDHHRTPHNKVGAGNGPGGKPLHWGT